ncbi:MAG: hypothetical protein JW985_02585 [Alphaproteobacteria bacterium]|nr:hypothetical protein [Alphaproteobacteria bacterium]
MYLNAAQGTATNTDQFMNVWGHEGAHEYTDSEKVANSVGGGNITIVNGNTDGLNRDTKLAQEITKDLVTGALDSSVTVDNRIFSESDRDSIIQDQKVMVDTALAAGEIVVDQIGKMTDDLFGPENQEVSKTYTSSLQFTSNYSDAEALKLKQESEFTTTLLENGQTLYCSPGHCFVDGPIEPIYWELDFAELGINLKVLKGLVSGIKSSANISDNIKNSEQYKNTQNKIEIKYEQKIKDQMPKRGWNEADIENTIKNPVKKYSAVDDRNNPLTGIKNNDPATLYQAKDGSYVIRNNKTGDVVQVSDKSNPHWQWPRNITEIK